MLVGTDLENRERNTDTKGHILLFPSCSDTGEFCRGRQSNPAASLSSPATITQPTDKACQRSHPIGAALRDSRVFSSPSAMAGAGIPTLTRQTPFFREVCYPTPHRGRQPPWDSPQRGPQSHMLSYVSYHPQQGVHNHHCHTKARHPAPRSHIRIAPTNALHRKDRSYLHIWSPSQGPGHHSAHTYLWFFWSVFGVRCFLYLVFPDSTGNRTQALTHARQVLYHRPTAPALGCQSAVLFDLFGGGRELNICLDVCLPCPGSRQWSKGMSRSRPW